MVLDDRDLRVRLAQMEADLAAARAAAGSTTRAGLAVAQLEASKAQAGAAGSTVASAEANYRKAIRLIATTPTLIAMYHRLREGNEVVDPSECEGAGTRFRTGCLQLVARP